MNAYSQNGDRAKPIKVAGNISSVFFLSFDRTIVADIIPDIVEQFGAVKKQSGVSVTLLLAAAGTTDFW